MKIEIQLKLNYLPQIQSEILFLQSVDKVCNQNMF